MNDAHTDADLLQQLHLDHEPALAALMKKYYTSLYSYASRFTHDKDLVKDCIQEVFISLWQRRETATSILSLHYYLLRAVKNKMLKSLSRKGLSVEPISDHDQYEFLQEYSIERFIIEKQVSDEQSKALAGLLQQLSPRQHEVIYLKFYQRLDQAQIAELMHLSRQSVYNLLHETLQKLRSLWMKEVISR